MEIRSIWLLDTDPPLELLNSNFECDVAIIGGGVSGISAAYHLSKLGLRVGVFEKDNLSTGSTGYSGGFLAASTTYDLTSLCEKWGEANAKRIYDSIRSAIESIEEVINYNKIDCDFRRSGAFYVAAQHSHSDYIKKEWGILNKLGYEAKLYNSQDPEIPVAKNFGALKTFSDCAFNPVSFVYGLRKIITEMGGSIFTGTRINYLKEKGDHLILRDEAGNTIKSKFVILATNGFSLSSYPRPEAVQQTSHIMVTKPIEGIRGKWSGELIWDTFMIYNYLRLLDDDRILIGGEDTWFGRKQGYSKEIEDRNAKLLTKLKQYFPEFKIETDFGWTGQLSYPIDGLPIVRTENRVTHIITDGIPFGWLTGQIAAGRITKKLSSVDDLYDFGRNFGFFKNLVIKSRLPNFIKSLGIKLGIALVHSLNTVDENFE